MKNTEKRMASHKTYDEVKLQIFCAAIQGYAANALRESDGNEVVAAALDCTEEALKALEKW